MGSILQSWKFFEFTEDFEGEPFYILELEDMAGVLPVMMSPTFYQQHRRVMSSITPFAVEGRMGFSPTTGEPVLQARRIYPLV